MDRETAIKLTAPLREYVEEKIGKLSKFLESLEKDGEAYIRVEVARRSHHHIHGEVYRAEGNLRFPGGMLRAEHSAEDARIAIDKVRDKLQREIRKYKTSH